MVSSKDVEISKHMAGVKRFESRTGKQNTSTNKIKKDEEMGKRNKKRL